ncbi:unnamed protein product [Adineta ricciae]|uniref:Uncharacterized protein n=1 Tax=Adineta ricciae TaxID=249248 RepID=A0A814Y578_ADIRI|nr:unnamed protein product [Adineta ricciae]CAF1437610.1 unnamed protein product [Adineta ricciae]
MDESELLNFNWFSEAGYSRLKAAKFAVRRAEAEDIKAIRDKMIEEGISYQYLPDNVRELPWGASCSEEKCRYEILQNTKLKFIQRKQLQGNSKQKEQAEKKQSILDVKRSYQENVVQRNKALNKTSAERDEDGDNLCSLLNAVKLDEQYYRKLLRDAIEKTKSIYSVYDISLACRENMLNGLSSLSNEQARNYCEKASLASLTIQEKLDSLDDRETLRGVRLVTEGESSLRYSLDPCCQRYKYIRVILQTVLTLKYLTNEEKIVFKEHLELTNGLIDKYEACYVFILVRAFLNGNDANYDDDDVKKFIEKCEEDFIRQDALFTLQVLVAVTALHFNRELQCPVLMFSIERYRNLSGSYKDKIVEKAIDILNQQEVQVCPIVEPVGSESIGSIPQFERPGKKSLARWCDRRNYLRIFDCPKVDFSIYIHKSEIVHIVKLVREQFKSDFDGQYEEEARLSLPHQPLSSSVVYLSKNKQNVKDIQGQLRSGREIIQIDPKDYYVRIDNVKESYGDLERILFQRLVKESSKYTLWFRDIINKSGENITSDHEFVLFAHAKAVSECARNLSTWMINSMCLDVIEKDINLDGKDNTDDQRMFSPWNLFFQHHSMTGGSYKNQIGEGNENQEEIEDKELYIIMNWLCIFWLGNENVTMVNDSDVCLSYLENIQRTKLEAAERYARTCILKMLFHRMYSTDSWDCNHFEETLLLRSSLPDETTPRRILGQMFFDKQPLRLIEDGASNFNDSPADEQLKKRRFEGSKGTDRDEVKRQARQRFQRLLETTKGDDTLRTFYDDKRKQLM